MGSSLSSGSIGSPSSELLLEDSEPSILMLPSELDAAVRSPLPNADQIELEFRFGESKTSELDLPFLGGIIIPF